MKYEKYNISWHNWLVKYNYDICRISNIYLVIKYRIDGVLSISRQLSDLVLTEQVISRIKVLAELDIGEKRIPQDGRFAVNINSREIDFRVSIMPGLFGEDALHQPCEAVLLRR